MTEFVVLYTHQKTKKAKTWQDGVLQVLPMGKKAVLYDDKKNRLDTVFVSPDSVAVGEQLESDKYLILVEEETSRAPGASAAPAQGDLGRSRGAPPVTLTTAQTADRARGDKCNPSSIGEARVGGLKRKRRDFVPPRMIRPAAPSESLGTTDHNPYQYHGAGLAQGQLLGFGQDGMDINRRLDGRSELSGLSVFPGSPAPAGIAGSPSLASLGPGVAGMGRMSLWSTVGPSSSSSLSVDCAPAVPGRPRSVPATNVPMGSSLSSPFPTRPLKEQEFAPQTERFMDEAFPPANHGRPKQHNDPSLFSPQANVREAAERQKTMSEDSKWGKYSKFLPSAPSADAGRVDDVGMETEHGLPYAGNFSERNRGNTACTSRVQSTLDGVSETADACPQASLPVKRSAAEVLALLKGKKRRVSDKGEATPSPHESACVVAQVQSQQKHSGSSTSDGESNAGGLLHEVHNASEEMYECGNTSLDEENRSTQISTEECTEQWRNVENTYDSGTKGMAEALEKTKNATITEPENARSPIEDNLTLPSQISAQKNEYELSTYPVRKITSMQTSVDQEKPFESVLTELEDRKESQLLLTGVAKDGTVGSFNCSEKARASEDTQNLAKNLEEETEDVGIPDDMLSPCFDVDFSLSPEAASLSDQDEMPDYSEDRREDDNDDAGSLSPRQNQGQNDPQPSALVEDDCSQKSFHCDTAANVEFDSTMLKLGNLATLDSQPSSISEKDAAVKHNETLSLDTSDVKRDTHDTQECASSSHGKEDREHYQSSCIAVDNELRHKLAVPVGDSNFAKPETTSSDPASVESGRSSSPSAAAVEKGSSQSPHATGDDSRNSNSQSESTSPLGKDHCRSDQPCCLETESSFKISSTALTERMELRSESCNTENFGGEDAVCNKMDSLVETSSDRLFTAAENTPSKDGSPSFAAGARHGQELEQVNLLTVRSSSGEVSNVPSLPKVSLNAGNPDADTSLYDDSESLESVRKTCSDDDADDAFQSSLSPSEFEQELGTSYCFLSSSDMSDLSQEKPFPSPSVQASVSNEVKFHDENPTDGLCDEVTVGTDVLSSSNILDDNFPSAEKGVIENGESTQIETAVSCDASVASCPLQEEKASRPCTPVISECEMNANEVDLSVCKSSCSCHQNVEVEGQDGKKNPRHPVADESVDAVIQESCLMTPSTAAVDVIVLSDSDSSTEAATSSSRQDEESVALKSYAETCRELRTIKTEIASNDQATSLTVKSSPEMKPDALNHGSEYGDSLDDQLLMECEKKLTLAMQEKSDSLIKHVEFSGSGDSGQSIHDVPCNGQETKQVQTDLNRSLQREPSCLQGLDDHQYGDLKGQVPCLGEKFSTLMDLQFTPDDSLNGSTWNNSSPLEFTQNSQDPENFSAASCRSLSTDRTLALTLCKADCSSEIRMPSVDGDLASCTEKSNSVCSAIVTSCNSHDPVKEVSGQATPRQFCSWNSPKKKDDTEDAKYVEMTGANSLNENQKHCNGTDSEYAQNPKKSPSRSSSTADIMTSHGSEYELAGFFNTPDTASRNTGTACQTAESHSLHDAEVTGVDTLRSAENRTRYESKDVQNLGMAGDNAAFGRMSLHGGRSQSVRTRIPDFHSHSSSPKFQGKKHQSSHFKSSFNFCPRKFRYSYSENSLVEQSVEALSRGDRGQKLPLEYMNDSEQVKRIVIFEEQKKESHHRLESSPNDFLWLNSNKNGWSEHCGHEGKTELFDMENVFLPSPNILQKRKFSRYPEDDSDSEVEERFKPRKLHKESEPPRSLFGVDAPIRESLHEFGHQNVPESTHCSTSEGYLAPVWYHAVVTGSNDSFGIGESIHLPHTCGCQHPTGKHEFQEFLPREGLPPHPSQLFGGFVGDADAEVPADLADKVDMALSQAYQMTGSVTSARVCRDQALPPCAGPASARHCSHAPSQTSSQAPASEMLATQTLSLLMPAGQAECSRRPPEPYYFDCPAGSQCWNKNGISPAQMSQNFKNGPTGRDAQNTKGLHGFSYCPHQFSPELFLSQNHNASQQGCSSQAQYRSKRTEKHRDSAVLLPAPSEPSQIDLWEEGGEKTVLSVPPDVQLPKFYEGEFFDEWNRGKVYNADQSPFNGPQMESPGIQCVPLSLGTDDRSPFSESRMKPTVPVPSSMSKQPGLMHGRNPASSYLQLPQDTWNQREPVTPGTADADAPSSQESASQHSEEGISNSVHSAATARLHLVSEQRDSRACKSVPTQSLTGSKPWPAGRGAISQAKVEPAPSKWEKFLPDGSDEEEDDQNISGGGTVSRVGQDFEYPDEEKNVFTSVDPQSVVCGMVDSNTRSSSSAAGQETEMPIGIRNRPAVASSKSEAVSNQNLSKLETAETDAKPSSATEDCAAVSESGSVKELTQESEIIVLGDSSSSHLSSQQAPGSSQKKRPTNLALPRQTTNSTDERGSPTSHSTALASSAVPQFQSAHDSAFLCATPRNTLQREEAVPFSPEMFSTLPPVSPPMSLSPLSSHHSEEEAMSAPGPPRMCWKTASLTDRSTVHSPAVSTGKDALVSYSERNPEARGDNGCYSQYRNVKLDLTNNIIDDTLNPIPSTLPPDAMHGMHGRNDGGQFKTPRMRISRMHVDCSQERLASRQTLSQAQSTPGQWQFRRPRPAGTPVQKSPSWSGSQICSQATGQAELGAVGKAFSSPTGAFGADPSRSGQMVLTGDLRFPGRQEVEGAVSPTRQVVIPVCFPTVAQYRQVFSAAVREHLNILLFDLSKTYHSALSCVDISALDGGMGSCGGGASSSPACQCGNPSKMVQVKKAGPNQGRFFFACSAPRQKQCKFFQWADQVEEKGRGQGRGGATRGRLKVTDTQSLATYCRSAKLLLYPGCVLIRRSSEKYGRSSATKNFPAWVRARQQEDVSKKSMYLKLSRRDGTSFYAKDDLWVVSRDLTFSPSLTFLAKSAYYGPNSQSEVELEPLSGYCRSNWPDSTSCHAILAGNATSEFACLENLHEYLQPSSLPVLDSLLHRENSGEKKIKSFSTPFASEKRGNVYVPGEIVRELATEFVERHQLNEDQAEALHRVAAMMSYDQPSEESLLLIHGVFGAGKSFLLSVIIMFLVEVFSQNDSHAPNSPFPWKILISSTTNVAVDRVLLGLLNLGFDDFVRVGSVKKIAKPVLPYSVHAAGSDTQELRDLQEMLKGDLTPSEKQFVRRTIEKQRLGENKKRLGQVRVVGVTCAATCFSCLRNIQFPFVVLDECSQMTEPSSMLPIARFGCHKLILVGDPKQLDPTIQGSEASHSRGLEQTLFDRTLGMGYVPVMLRTQYRCHPVISQIANQLFYAGQLRDGVLAEDRPPLLSDFPTLCFYDVSGGQEEGDGSGSYYNEAEVALVVLLIEALVQGGVDPRCIGVITLYKAQMYKIIAALSASRVSKNRELKGVQVSTVDAFQGGEREIILLSSVRTAFFGFIDSSKRINVALTRAKNHLFIIGSLKNLSRNDLWSKIISHCRGQPGGVRTGREVQAWLERLLEDSSAADPSSIPSGAPAPSQRSRPSRGSQWTLKSQLSDTEGYSPPMSLSDLEDFENSSEPVAVSGPGKGVPVIPSQSPTACTENQEDVFSP